MKDNRERSKTHRITLVALVAICVCILSSYSIVPTNADEATKVSSKAKQEMPDVRIMQEENCYDMMSTRLMQSKEEAMKLAEDVTVSQETVELPEIVTVSEETVTLPEIVTVSDEEATLPEIVTVSEETIELPEIVSVEQGKMRPLEEILNDPNAKVIELIPYLTGTYEEKVDALAHLAWGETRDCSAEVQMAEMAVATVRAFDSSVSDGTGSLVSAITRSDTYNGKTVWQYSCVPGGGYYQQPSEDCYENARRFLEGDLEEPDMTTDIFFIATIEFKGKPIVRTYQVHNWMTADPNDTLTVYLQKKW